MVFNDDITIYNHYKVDRIDRWARTTIKGVSRYAPEAVTQTKSGQQSDDYCKIRIPLHAVVEGGKTYLAPKAWQALSDKSKHWTIQHNDRIVNALSSYEIVFKSTELEELFQSAATVIKYSDNRRGIPLSQHWRVDCR